MSDRRTHPDERIWRDAIARRLVSDIGMHYDGSIYSEAHMIADVALDIMVPEAPQTRPRRRRYRCPVCFTEALKNADDLAYSDVCRRGGHEPAKLEPVARRSPVSGGDEGNTP